MESGSKSSYVRAQVRANRRALAFGLAVVGMTGMGAVLATWPVGQAGGDRVLMAVAAVNGEGVRSAGAGVVESGRSQFRAQEEGEGSVRQAREAAERRAVEAAREAIAGEVRGSAEEDLQRREGGLRGEVERWMGRVKDAVAGRADGEEKAGEEAAKSSVKMFDGREIRAKRRMKMVVTAYSPDERSCGESADGITASGYTVWTNGMEMVAADTEVLPFGSLVSVPGYAEGRVVPVLDRGGAIKGKRLDVLYATHEVAERWGVREVEVTVWEYVEPPGRSRQ